MPATTTPSEKRSLITAQSINSALGLLLDGGITPEEYLDAVDKANADRDRVRRA